MFYYNFQSEELENYLSFLDIKKSASIEDAEELYIDLEKYIFSDYPQFNFANHKFTLRELDARIDKLIKLISKEDGSKKKCTLFINLIDVKSSVTEDLFWWSFYNNKFTESKGRDTEAMEKWHNFENIIDATEIDEFKLRRETNLSFYLEIIKRHLFFDTVIFAGIDSGIKQKIKFGLDIAEEKYINKMIEENEAQATCSIIDRATASPLLKFTKDILVKHNIKNLKVNAIKNSNNLEPRFEDDYHKIFFYLGLQEVALNETDLALLINDLDLLSALPYIDTEKPIGVIDLSSTSSPNFGYILLKDEGFNQVYSYAKKRENEQAHEALARSLSQALMYFITQKNFVEQIAINYMDDFFIPLSHKLGKTLRDFSGPINTLADKLELDPSQHSKKQQTKE